MSGLYMFIKVTGAEGNFKKMYHITIFVNIPELADYPGSTPPVHSQGENPPDLEFTKN